MWKFLWNGKKARCPKYNLTPHKRVGGAGLTYLHDYFWAVTLVQLKHWFQGPDRPIWVDIEERQTPTKTLKTFLMGDNWKHWNIKHLSPPIRVSIQAWRYLLSLKHTEEVVIDVQHPLDILEAQIPMLSIKPLSKQGITQISDLFTDQQPNSVEQILHDYNLPKNTLFTCVRISHFLKTNAITKTKIPNKAWQNLFHNPQ